MKKSPIKKTEKKVIQDYSRNAIADYKAGDTKAANYEKKNLMNDNPVASRASSPMKMKGSYLSKHMKSGM